MSAIDDKLKEFAEANNKQEQIEKLQELLEIPEFRDELNESGLLGYVAATYIDLVLAPLRETLNKKLSWRELDDGTAHNVINHVKNGDWVNTKEIYSDATGSDGDYANIVEKVIEILKKISIYPDTAAWSEYLASKLKAAYTKADWAKLVKIDVASYGDNKSYFKEDIDVVKEKLKKWGEKTDELFTQLFTSLTEWEKENDFFILDPRFIYVALLRNKYFWNEYLATRNDQVIVEEFQKISQSLINTIANDFNNAGSVEDWYADLYKKYKEQFSQNENQTEGENQEEPQEPPEEDVTAGNSDT